MPQQDITNKILDTYWIRGIGEVHLPFTYIRQYYTYGMIPLKSDQQILEEIVCKFAELNGCIID